MSRRGGKRASQGGGHARGTSADCSAADAVWTEEQRRPGERSGGGCRGEEGREHLRAADTREGRAQTVPPPMLSGPRSSGVRGSVAGEDVAARREESISGRRTRARDERRLFRRRCCLDRGAAASGGA